MGREETEDVAMLKNGLEVKARGSICRVLREILERIGCILPVIESARPGCTSGIKELCCLYNTIDKANLLLQHCAESSKLYLAITAEATLCRSERIRTALDQCLCQIQSMVPQTIAVQISDVVSRLRGMEFDINSADKEAGKSMLELFRHTEASERLEFEAFQIAACALNITSPKALLVERRAVQKLLDKLHGSDAKKEMILHYFLHLLKKYGKKLKSVPNEQVENASPAGLISNAYSNNTMSEIKNEPTYHSAALTDLCSSSIPPKELCCPITSKLMIDPVIITSGQTYEKTCIQKWFDEGHDTCPKTQQKLESLSMISNTCMKDLISQWCFDHGLDTQYLNAKPDLATSHSWGPSHCNSISSLSNISAALLYGNNGERILQSNLSDLSNVSSDASYCSDKLCVEVIQNSENNYAHMFLWSDDYQSAQSFCNFSYDMFLGFFSTLSELPLELQGKAVQDFKVVLEGDDYTCYVMLSNGFANSLIKFMKSTNVQGQKIGARIFLSFLINSRNEISSLDEDAFLVLNLLIDSKITAEALMIMEKLTQHTTFISYIKKSSVLLLLIKVLESANAEFLELAVGILYDLSFHGEIKAHIISSGSISRLVPLLSNLYLVEKCISIIRNLCDNEEGAKVIAETDGCLASIAEVLESGTHKEQEQAVAILDSLCSRGSEYRQLASRESIIPALVYISINGNLNAKNSASKLLHLLGGMRDSRC